MLDFQKILNPEQCAAATAEGGPLLVLAAAGTGKTRTLVHRVACLVERGVPPERILLLTFTNRAAREMLERAQRVVPGVEGIWSGTFHSICAKFLRRWGSPIGVKPGFTIIDEDDQKKMMGQIIKENVKNVKDFPKKDLLLKMVSDSANMCQPLEHVVARYQTAAALGDVRQVLAVCRAYQAKKAETGVMDFDDLLVNGLRLLKESERVRAFLQEHFLHVLVDEYQDTNTIQAEFTDLLAARHRNLMVVGDDFQCIYTWRGARFENIREFPSRWPDCKVVKLERNYRSLPPILDVANTVMKDVPQGFDKTLRPFRADGSAVKPRLYHVWDGRAQAQTIVQLLTALHAQGTPFKDIAVLYRAHYSSIEIQMELARNRIPFRITSGVGVFEQMHVKDVLAFLRLCVDSTAELSFLRLVELLPGVGEGTARKYWKNLGGQFNGLNAFDRMNLGSMMCAKGKADWEKIARAFEAAAEPLASGRGHLLVQIFTDAFYADCLHRQFDPNEADQRLEDLTEITAQIASVKGGVMAFLQEVALMTNLDARGRADLPEDHVHLTTIHQAKGMEWPVVVLPWLVDTVFPSSRALEAGDTAEERRLFYVAVTRAQNRLYLCVPKSRKMADGGLFPVEPSVFVREIPKQLVDEQTLYSYTEPPRRRAFDDDDDDFDDDDDGFGGGGWRGARGGYGGRGGGSSRGGRSGGGTFKTTWRR